MNRLTVRGKMELRGIISTICSIILLCCIFFAPLISISQTEDFFGNEIKIYANISLVKWFNGGEVDFYISDAEKGGSKDKIKYDTLDIEEDLKDPNLAYKNSDLSEEEKLEKSIEVETNQQVAKIFLWLIIVVVLFVVSLSLFLANKTANNIVANLEKNRASAEKIEKAKKDLYLKNNFRAGPYRFPAEIILLSIAMIVAMYILIFMKKECADDDLRFGLTWWGYAVLAISFIPLFVNEVLSKSIVKDVEKYNISNPDVVKTMPFFGSNATFDFNAGTVTSGANYNANMSNFSSNKEIGNAKSISEYKKLLDEGAITQEEYDKLKEKILFRE